MNIESIKIQPYGLILGLAMVSAIWVINKILTSHNFPKNFIDKSLLYVVGCGLIGARGYHVISEWSYYQDHISEIVAVWNGGIGIYGALIGGFLGLLITSKINKHSRNKFVILLDSVAISLPLAQSIGRWGNYVNQEIYGYPTNLPWAISIDLTNRLPGYLDIEKYHPLFLYESISNLILFSLLFLSWKWRKIELGSGISLAVYGIGYGITRWCLENFRIDRQFFGGQGIAQNISILMITVGIFWLGYYYFSKNKLWQSIH